MRDGFDIIGFVVIAAFVLFFAMVTTYALTGTAWEQSAVAHGHGEYLVDDKGNVRWRWKEVGK